MVISLSYYMYYIVHLCSRFMHAGTVLRQTVDHEEWYELVNYH